MAEPPPAPSFDELEAMIPRYAGFGRRSAAALADFAILIVIETFLFVPMGWDWLAAPASELAWVPPLLLLIVPPLLYDALLTASRGQATWGKRFAATYVSDTAGKRLSLGRAALRHLAKYLSAATLGVGIFVQPFTYRKQALHDLITKTVVRER